MMADERAKRLRATNFTDKESDALLIAVRSRIGLIRSKLKTADICKKKRQAWGDIADEVNAVGGFSRSWESMKKR
jgi:hypothetical protein